MRQRSTVPQPNALVTIVSANYLPAARVLCRSFGELHPLARRFVVIVDRPAASAARSDEPFEAIDVLDLGIPDAEDLLAQYSVLEANTAVKPYALRHLFERYGFDRIVYLDPDIWVQGSLEPVFELLDSSSIVLTPHMRDPFRDDAKPREIDILRSGTYNLGFIALRRGQSSSRLLEWWMQKTEHDCVVDFDQGLFVDQKWMDLVPAYFDDVAILRRPGYNVAYWNLHERELSISRNGRYLADGEPVAFFHFSGFDPDHPSRPSIHQDRHHSRDNAALVRLLDEYRLRILAEGYREARHVPYGFATLRNGVPVSNLVRRVVRHCRKHEIPFPSVTDAEAFSRFLMTPNSAVTGRDVSPFAHFVFQLRADVAAAYPRAIDDAEEPGFLYWARNSGHEVGGRELYESFGSRLGRVNPFVRIKRIYERRADLQRQFPGAFTSSEGLESFSNWLRRHGISEEDIDDGDVTDFVEGGRHGFSRVLDYYCSTPEIASEFPYALLPWANTDFRDWMLRHGVRLAAITATDLEWFQHRALCAAPGDLVLLSALRGHVLRTQAPIGATVLGWSGFCEMVRSAARLRGATAPELPENLPDRIPSIVQLEMLHAGSQAHRGFEAALRSTSGTRELADSLIRPLNSRLTHEQRRRLLEPLATHAPARGVNVAGHFHYAAGAGDAAHALVHALDAVGIAHCDVTLPVNPSRMCAPEPTQDLVPARFWAVHRPDFEVSITVANADVMPAARTFLGPCWDRNRKHIAHWVWETDRLPGRYAEAAEGLDAIWTPSEFSARGLRATLGDAIPVEVVPYSVSQQTARDPRPFPIELPEDRTLFGFFFDARSVLERKNPKAVLSAFKAAFRKDDRVTLVLKVNHASAARKQMGELEQLAQGLPVIWLRDVRLDEFQQRALISRLDAYVSLHRSEGFGLVLANAMALGKPVIATRYSGNLEYMSDSTAVLVGAREIVTDQSYGSYPRGTRWAEPNHEEAVLALRSLHLDADLRREIGERARAHIGTRLSPRVVGGQVAQLLEWSIGDSGMGRRQLTPTQFARVHAESVSHNERITATARRETESADPALDPQSPNQHRSWPAE